MVAQTLGCLDRIQDFLSLEKRFDYRNSSSPPGSSKGSSEKNIEGLRPIITTQGCDFGWTKDKAILKDVSVDVPPSSFTLVVGPVASGKSTLLKSFLGETYLHSGSMKFEKSDDVVYCDQDAWILNGTIKENIVAFSDYSPDF